MLEQGSGFNPEPETKIESDNLDSLVEKFDNETDKLPESLRQKSRDELFELLKQGVDLYKNLSPAGMDKITDKEERNKRYLDFTKVSALNGLIHNLISDSLDQQISGQDETMRLLQLKEQEVTWKRDLAQVEYQRVLSTGDFGKAEQLQKNYYLLSEEASQASRAVTDFGFKRLQEK